MISSGKSPDQPIVADGGIRESLRRSGDPFAALDELMVVIEALCPKWPKRDSFGTMSRMLL